MHNKQNDMYRSVDHLKRHARFYPKGRIIPRYLMLITHPATGKALTKHRHKLTFGSNSWVVHRNGKFAVYMEDTIGVGGTEAAISVRRLVNAHIKGLGDGEVLWSGTHTKSRDGAVKAINMHLFGSEGSVDPDPWMLCGYREYPAETSVLPETVVGPYLK